MIEPVKTKTGWLSRLRGPDSVLQYDLGPFGMLIGAEIVGALVGLYLLVFQFVGLSTTTYLTIALVLGLVYEHGRALWRKRRWAYKVCLAYGVLVILIGVAGVGLSVVRLGTSKTNGLFTLLMGFGFISGGWNLIKQSRLMLKSKESEGGF